MIIYGIHYILNNDIDSLSNGRSYMVIYDTMYIICPTIWCILDMANTWQF